MFDSVGLNFSPSSTTATGVDDFIKIKGSPFCIRECLTTYNSSTGKQEVVMYEDDPNYASNRTNSNYNIMIEFPKFYYKRPSKYEFYVSSYPHDGFLPSPMHYRNGHLYDYCYISKYHINTQFMSQTNSTKYCNTDWANTVTWGDINSARNGVRPHGMFLMDFPSFCMIWILSLIKYNTTDLTMTGAIHERIQGSLDVLDSKTGITDGILSKDGELYLDPTNMKNRVDVIFGLECLNTINSTMIDGIRRDKTNGDVYISTNIENVSDITSFSGIKVNTRTLYSSKSNIQGTVSDMSFDLEYPWMLFPTQADNLVDRETYPSENIDLTKVHGPFFNAVSYYNYNQINCGVYRGSFMFLFWFLNNAANRGVFRSMFYR